MEPAKREIPPKKKPLRAIQKPRTKGEKSGLLSSPSANGRLNRIYETILSNTDDFAYIFDPQGRFLFANAPLLKVWDKTLREVIGKTCHDLGYPDWHADMHLREIEEVVRTKNQIRGEVPFTGASGIFGVYDYIFKPVLDAHGKVEMIVGTTRDITDRKRDEEKLAAAQLELLKRSQELESKVEDRTASLQETVELLESFTYSIVHDMRAPLRSMQGYAQILATEHQSELSPEAAHYLARISNSALRLDHLIQDVLTFSRAAREDLKLGPVDTGVLLKDILLSYPNLESKKEFIHLEGQLPVVLGNEAALTQCFSNLLGNALKFSQPGKNPSVRVYQDPDAPRPRLVFTDNGIGIPSHLHDRIFDLFQRVDPSREGNGIGLTIVRKAVERMGGKVGVSAHAGPGSSFWVELEPAPAPEGTP